MDPKKNQEPKFRNYGYCYCCNQSTLFSAYGDWWRDYYICGHCGSIPRERAIMYCIDQFYPNWRSLVIHESSPAAQGASKRLKNEAPHYIPTHFIPGTPGGKKVHGLQCEDLERLTFKDETIDLHISQDVMEHLFDPVSAFREIARTLKPGGAHIFTTPLIHKTTPTIRTALREPDGKITMLIPEPEYHLNPDSKEGSLVTVHWGYDIVQQIFDACGLFTEMILIDNLDLGIRAELNEVLITRKPAGNASPH